jgi:hypothetical protein
MSARHLGLLVLVPLVALGGCGDGAETVVQPTGGGPGSGGNHGGSGGDAASGPGGHGADGGGGAEPTPCEPGASEACYTGPAGTEGIGACVGGTRTCLADGSDFGPCEGEVVPAPETCNTPEDDDCDDEVNEAGAGCVCTPGSSTYCYTGDPATENHGICVGGIKTCDDQGTSYGACIGEVTPAAQDDCSTPLIDEDCDTLTPVCPADWALVLGDAGVQVVHALGVDGAGNTLIGGEFAGTITLATPHTSAGLQDAFVAKLDTAGMPLWSRSYGNSDIQSILGLAVDGNGDVWVTGYFRGTINFGGGVLTSAGGADIFVAKLSGADGAQLFAARYGSATDDQVGNAVAVDGANDVWVTGFFAGTINFGGGTRSSGGLTDAFALKLTSAGAHAFSQRYGGTDHDSGRAVAITAANDALLVGDFFSASIDLGGGALTNAGAGKTDIYVAMLDAAGAHQWSTRFGDAGFQFARAVTRGPGGGPLVGGESEGAVDFGGGLLTSIGGFDAFLLELDAAAGAFLSAQLFGDVGDESILGVAYDPTGFFLLAGYTTGAISFGADPLTSAGGRDGFVAKVDASGGPYWSRLFGDETFYQEATAVAVDATGTIHVSGQFSGDADLGAGSVTSAGSTDAFVATYPP